MKVPPTIQDIQLFKTNSSANISFQLQFVSNVTSVLNTPLTSSAVEDALNSLPSVASVGRVKVILEDTTRSLRMAAIFISNQSSLPRVTVINGSGFNQINSSVVQAMSSSPSFRLGFGNRATQPLAPVTSTTNMNEAVLNLFTTICQRSGGGRVFYNDTYDTPGKRRTGTVDGSVEPFCGRHSLKKPTDIWRNNYQTVDDDGTQTGTSGLLTVGASPSRQQFRYVSAW